MPSANDRYGVFHFLVGIGGLLFFSLYWQNYRYRSCCLSRYKSDIFHRSLPHLFHFLKNDKVTVYFAAMPLALWRHNNLFIDQDEGIQPLQAELKAHIHYLEL